MLTSSSRLYTITVGDKKTVALVPYADQLNHTFPEQVKWEFDVKLNSFVVKAAQRIPRGHEICVCYGFKSNISLLMNFGFVFPDNKAQSIMLKFYLDPNDPLYQVKKDLISDLDFMEFEAWERFESPMAKSMLSWIRYVCYEGKPDDLPRVKAGFMKKCGNPDECFALLIQAPISLKNEIKMWETILKVTERKYKTTYGEDREILKKPDLTYN